MLAGVHGPPIANGLAKLHPPDVGACRGFQYASPELLGWRESRPRAALQATDVSSKGADQSASGPPMERGVARHPPGWLLAGLAMLQRRFAKSSPTLTHVLNVAALRIYCADIGSVPGGAFGWARDCGPGGDPDVRRGGAEIVELAEAIGDDLKAKVAVALGFECPLWVPIPEDPFQLGKARPGEGDRPWSAGAGAVVLATGLPQVVWILRAVAERAGGPPAFFLDWFAFSAAGSGVFLWEAFVTKKAKLGTHTEDAAAAVKHFIANAEDPAGADLGATASVYSLVGAALLRAGWSDDVNLLGRPCLVMRAPKA